MFIEIVNINHNFVFIGVIIYVDVRTTVKYYTETSISVGTFDFLSTYSSIVGLLSYIL
jgi:hypothetical protein